MSRINSISIKRFKRLVDVSLELATTTLLIGSNNAGKSSVLQAIQFAVSLAQSAKLVGGVQWLDDKYELSFGQTQMLYCPVSDAMTLASGGKLVEDAAQRVEVKFTMDDGASSIVTLRKGRNRNVKVAVEGRVLGETLQNLTEPFSVYAPGLAGIPRTETFINAGLLRRVVARGDANLVLRNVLLELSRDPARWGLFLTDMQRLFPGLELDIEFEAHQDEHISVYFTLDDGPRVPFDAAGTAVLQASQLLSYVSLFQPRLLILDEPDSHLHPDRQRQLCRLLCEIAEQRHFQIVMSSHSRHVLDALARRSRVVWLSKGSIVPSEDVDTQKLLLDLGALDSVDYLADGQIRCLVATEDTDQRFIETLLEASGFPTDDVEIVSYPGCSQTEAAIVLGCFLREKAPHIQLIVHRDRDYLPESDVNEFRNRLAKQGIHPWVTDGSDIEGYFISPQHLIEANPGLSESRAGELHSEAIGATTEKSVRAIVNLRTQHAFRQRNKGGPNVDHGQIAVDATNEFGKDPVSMCRGDVVLGTLTALLQKELSKNPQVAVVTKALSIPSLRELRDKIWDNAHV